jgi:predicted RNase H-like HicB family nuclease
MLAEANFGMTDASKPQEHKFLLEVTQGATGMYVGQVVQIPEIMVQADTKAELFDEAKIAIQGYLKAFPETHKELENRPLLEYQPLEIIVS